MIWSIVWDIIWSIYEWDNIKTKDFLLFPNWVFFTDDSVLTLATMYAILNNKSYWNSYCEFYKKYPWKGYWWKFIEWCDKKPLFWFFKRNQDSYGNWSAMRVSPVWYVCDNIEDTLKLAKKTAICTHWHKEWIKWAQAISLAIFYSRKWKNKDFIRNEIEKRFNYDLSRSLETIRPNYTFDVTCQWSVPESIISFLESTGFEDAIRNAISLWWDSDTIACITWSIAEAYFGIPEDIYKNTISYLDNDSKEIINNFYEKYWLKKYWTKKQKENN